MKRSITFTISTPSREEHPHLFVEKFLAGVFGYTLTRATRLETYADLIQVKMTSIFDVKPEEEMLPITARLHFDKVLRGLLVNVPELRFVCVDSVRTVPGATHLAAELSGVFERIASSKGAVK